MTYLKQAKEIKKEFWAYQEEPYEYSLSGENVFPCVKECKDKALSLRNQIIGVCMMRGFKSKQDEEAVKILDDICSCNTGSGNDGVKNG